MEHGEGTATREWLSRAYVNLGELQAQMSRLQYEQLQRVGLAPVRMRPVMAALATAAAKDDSKSEDARVSSPEPEVLHTHTAPLSEVLSDLNSWHPALLEEFNSIRHKLVSKGELKNLEQEGREVLYVPGKLVATVKACTGKRKARVVACGNFLGRERPQSSPTLARGDILAAGLDSLALMALRAQVAAVSLDHLSDDQRAIYDRLLAQWRGDLSEVD